MIVQFKLRRGTTAQWVSANPVLAPGEPGFASDTGVLKIGDGSSTWLALDEITGGSTGNDTGGTGTGGDYDDTALQTKITALTNQQTQLMTVAATTDELLFAVQIPSVASGGDAVLSTLTAVDMTVFVAPVRMRILSAAFIRDFNDTPADATNYLRLNLVRYTGNNTLVGEIVNRDTITTGMLARQPFLFDGSTWSATNRVLEIGDHLRFQIRPNGTAAFRCPASLTIRYQPL